MANSNKEPIFLKSITKDNISARHLLKYCSYGRSIYFIYVNIHKNLLFFNFTKSIIAPFWKSLCENQLKWMTIRKSVVVIVIEQQLFPLCQSLC